jgi:hypothetical protein
VIATIVGAAAAVIAVVIAAGNPGGRGSTPRTHAINTSAQAPHPGVGAVRVLLVAPVASRSRRHVRGFSWQDWLSQAPARQQAGPVQAPPAPANKGRLRQPRRAVPRDQRAGTPAATPPSATTLTSTFPPRRRSPGPAGRPRSHRLAHPPSRLPDRRRGPQLMALLERCPELQAACGHVRKRGSTFTGAACTRRWSARRPRTAAPASRR